MRLCISNIAWKDSHEPKVFELLKSKGFKSLEGAPARISPDLLELNDDSLINIRNKYDCMGLPLISMQSLLYGSKGCHLFESEISRSNLTEHLKKLIRISSLLGIKNLVFGSPRNRIVPTLMRKDVAKDIAMSFFSEIGSVAKRNNTTLSIEPNASKYGGNYLTKTIETIDFIRELKNEGIKLNLDLSTVTLENEELDYILEKSDGLINHVHISDPFLEPVMSNIEKSKHQNYKRSLKNSNYEGSISIEMAYSSIEETETSIDHVLDVYGDLLH